MVNPLVDFKGQIRLDNAHPDVIRAVQRSLIAAQLLEAPEDGKPELKTLAAFSKFKQLEYLEHLEILGPSTAKALLEVVENHPLVTDSPTVFDAALAVYIPSAGQVTSRQAMPGAKRFTWGELTKGLTRVPSTAREVNNLVKLAQYLDKVSNFLDNRPITITSGFRPLAINKAVGGVSSSRHIQGDAADFTVAGLTPHAVFRRLDRWHGDKGGLGDGATFSHLDLRGYRARFGYG